MGLLGPLPFGISRILADNRNMTLSKKIILPLLAVLPLVLFQTAHSQTTSELRQRIRTAVESRDWTTARAEAEKLRTTDPTLFQNLGSIFLPASRIPGIHLLRPQPLKLLL